MRLLLCIFLLSAHLLCAGENVMEFIKNAPKNHPRLFFTPDQVGELKQKFNSDPLLKNGYMYALKMADTFMGMKPVKRIKTGKRLLHVSREALKRITYLSFAYRFSGEKKYASRAEQEMAAAAGFYDWNPSHFLDVAEMTAALGIGYDWCFDALSEKGKAKIKKGLLELGLKPGVKGGYWAKAHNNWNQVCNGGLVVGSLALLEDYPEIAEKIISRAVSNLPNVMKNYAPDGAYPEGPAYWMYGTSYNVMLIAALESALGTDFGISKQKGFLESSDYYLHVCGTSGYYFNYSDCGLGGKGIAAPAFWFALKRNDPSLLWRQKNNLVPFLGKEPNLKSDGDRIFPLALVWSSPLDIVEAPEQLSWNGRGLTPVGFHRSSWDAEGIYAGIKGGSPAASHAHMDVGSFVLDADGERWVHDLGNQNYNGLESKGINIWNSKQNSERWTVFRLNNFGHNTLVVDNKLQIADSKSEITGFSDKPEFSFTRIDMSPAYKGQVSKVHRGLALIDGKSVIVQDEITAPNKDITVRWGFITKADADIKNDTTAVLRQNGKIMTVKVLEGADVKLEIYNTEKPKKPYDEPNKDTRMVGFTVKLKAGSENTFAVQFVPGSIKETEYKFKSLMDWESD